MATEAGPGHRQARNRRPRTYGITITHPGVDAALYQRYPQQFSPEPVYIYIDLSERRIWATTGTAWEPRDWDDPAIVRYRMRQDDMGIDSVPTADAAYRLMCGLASTASRMAAGYRPYRTQFGRWETGLNHNARRAEANVTAQVESRILDGSSVVGAWDADTTSQVPYDEAFDITASTTDDELADIEDQIRNVLGPDAIPEWNIVVWDGLWEHLVELRDGLAARGEAA